MKNSEKFDMRAYLSDNKIKTGKFIRTELKVVEKTAYGDTKKLTESKNKGQL